MSRYWVFTEEQLQDAILAWDAPTSARIAVCAFLDSQVAIDMGMARDIAAPTAPEIRIFPAAGTSESISEEPKP